MATALISALIVITVYYRHSYTFHLLYAWPSGSTWSSVIAWLESDFIILFLLWYFRDRVGKRLTRWWHQHRAGQMSDHMAEVREHVAAEMTSFESKIHVLLADHHDKIITAVNGHSGKTSQEPKNAVLAAADEDDEDGRAT